MYSNKLAVAIKSNGKVLREINKDTVYLPFGSEYSIFIKNLNTVRALVKVEIDGQDVTGDGGLVVYGNTEVDIERFIKDLNKGNRFKFIERTANIENHRGVGVEDGLVRVEFQFEKPQPAVDWYKPTYPVQPNPYKWGSPYDVWYSTCDANTYGSSPRGISVGGGTTTSCTTTSAPMNATYTSSGFSAPAENQAFVSQVNDTGITVPGSISDQKFTTASWFPVEDTKHVMVFKLLGETEKGKAIVKPVTVKAKPKCTSCGRQNKATAKFCVECGTSLQIV